MLWHSKGTIPYQTPYGLDALVSTDDCVFICSGLCPGEFLVKVPTRHAGVVGEILIQGKICCGHYNWCYDQDGYCSIVAAAPSDCRSNKPIMCQFQCILEIQL